MGQCAATFTGVNSIKSAFAVRSLGVFPNSMTITFVPQNEDIARIGQLTLAHGTDYVTFPDVIVDYTTIKMSTNGHVMVARLRDRRWRWRFAHISGRYNVRLADGTIEPSTEKSLQELAALCFDEMQELSYDVSALPADQFPEVDWVEEKAAMWLHEVCEGCGCDVSLNLDDTVSIVQLGTGALLPDNSDLMTPSISTNPAEGPDKVAVVCNETQYQCRLKTIAVGLDTDGEIKPLDDLSYTPSGGWNSMSESTYLEELKNQGRSDREISCARRSVFRWFQIDSVANGSMNIPGYGVIDSIAQILPLNNYILESYSAFSGTKQMRKPDLVYCNDRKLSMPPDDTDDGLVQIDSEFSVDRQLGLVKFSRPMLRHESDGTLLVADVYLETSFGVRSNDTGQQDRFIGTLDLVSGGGPLKDVSRREDIGLVIRAVYSSDDATTHSSVEDNEDELLDEVDAALSAMAAQWTGSIFGYGNYRGIHAFNTDGSIRQVGWWVSDNGYAHTMASVNSEAVPGVLRWNDRRRRRISEQTSDHRSYELNITKLRNNGSFRGGFL